MISKSHMEKLSKSKPTEVWCYDSFGEQLMKFDRLSLCSQIKAIPIEDVVAMLTELQLEIEEIEIDCPNGFEPVSKTSAFYDGVSASSRVIQEKINALKEKK